MNKYYRLFLQFLILPVFPCFLKGTNPDDFNKPTEVERAQTETAARIYNLFLEGKPVTDAYLADVSRNAFGTTGTVQGEAAVDMAKLTPTIANPNAVNGGMNAAGITGMAGKRAKVMSDIGQDSISQQAAGKKSAVENALGIQSTANTAQAGMAADAVSRNISSAQADYASNAATKSSLTSLAGAGAGMAMGAYKKPGVK